MRTSPLDADNQVGIGRAGRVEMAGDPFGSDFGGDVRKSAALPRLVGEQGTHRHP